MKLFLQTILCFAFVVTVFGQGYGRRRPKPVVKPKVVGPSPVVQKPPYTTGDVFNPMFGHANNGLDSLRGGGMGGMPDEIKRIIGSTISGRAIVGGMAGFPRHGGTLNENGIVNGWGADPNEPVIPAVNMWNDPLNGAAFPEDYSGQELVFDPVTNRYVVQSGGAVGHQIAKETHVAAKSGGIVAGGVPSSHNTVKAEHNIVKEANHIVRKTVAGVPGGVGTIGAVGGVVSPVGVVDPVGHGIAKSVQHDAVKASGVIAAGRPPVSHGFVNSMGTVNAGHFGIDDPRVIAHNVREATLGADAVLGHNIAKSAGPPVGVGFIDPTGPVASQVNHDIAKSASVSGVDPFGIGVDPFAQLTSGGMVAGDPIVNHGMAKASRHVGISQLGTVNAGHIGIDAPRVIAHNVRKATLGEDAVIGHNIAKASGPPVGVGFIDPAGPVATQIGHDIAKSPVGVVGAVGISDPVHNINKVGQSGIATLGHDPLASTIGHGIAKQAVGEAAHAVNMGSRGGVLAGDPVALSATHGLAKESLHVAGKTMDMASSGIAGRRHIAPGMNIFGQGSMMVHPKPAKKPFPTITGYGRRRRD